MFLDYLPDYEWLKIATAFASVFAVWGAAAAVGWYWIRKAYRFWRPDLSAMDD